MFRLLRYCIAILLLTTPAYAAINQVAEEDGDPSQFPWKVKVPNGSMTNNGDGTASLDWVTTATALWTRAGTTLSPTTAGDNVDVSGHMALGADATVSATTVLGIDETLTTVDTTHYGQFNQLNLEPAGALSASTVLVAMDLQAQWDSLQDGSTHGYLHGVKGEGVSIATAVGSGDINELIGVYGKASNLGRSDATSVIAGLFTATNDDALGTELGGVTNAYSLLARAYTDKDTGVIDTRYGLYVEDTTGGGLLTNQYGIYLEDMASGSASGTAYAIYSLGGNVELTDGDLTTTGTATLTTITDTVTTITGGNYTGVGNITGTDVDISAGTGDITTSGTISGGAGSNMLRLDTTNDPLTGNLEISKADPELRLTATEYARMVKSDTTNYAYQYNRVNVPAAVGGALAPNASGEYVTMGDNIGLVGTGTFTIVGWIKTPTAAYPTANSALAGKAGGGLGYILLINGAEIRTYIDGQHEDVATTGLNNDGAWHHYATVCDNGVVAMYLDGNYLGGGTLSDNSISATASNFNIGCYQDGASAELQASIDEVAIWSRALTSDDISDMYDAGNGYYLDGSNSFPTSGTSIGLNLEGLWHFDDGAGGTVADSSGNGIDGATVGMEGNEWTTGIVSTPGANQETVIWSSRDGGTSGEYGIQTYGDTQGRTIIEGSSTKFNSGGVEQFQIDTSGDLVFPDSQKTYFGTAKDSSIYYDNDLIINSQEVGTGGIQYQVGGQPWTWLGRGTGTLTLQGQTSALTQGVEIYTKDGDGTDDSYLNFYGVGTPDAITNRERIRLGWDNAGRYEIYTEAGGTGSVRELQLRTGTNTGQLVLTTSGNILLQNDNEQLYFGGGNDSNITDTGSLMTIDPDVNSAGSRYLLIDGQALMADKLLFTQTDGNEYIDSLNDGYMDYGATTAHRFLNNVKLTGDNRLLTLGASDDASIYYNGTNMIIKPDAVGTGYAEVSHGGSGVYLTAFQVQAGNNTTVGNRTQFKLGVNSTSGNTADLRFRYQGSSNASNSLDFGFQGDGNPIMSLDYGRNIYCYAPTLFNDKIYFTQTDGNEYIDSLADGYMDYYATTQHRFNNDIKIGTDIDIDWGILFGGDSNNGGITYYEDFGRFAFTDGITIVDPGSLLATPVAGTFEFDNDRMYLTNVGTQRAIDRTADVKVTTTTVENTTTETTVYTASCPANSWKAGNILKMYMGGDINNKAASAGHDVTIRVYVGATEVASVASSAGKLTDACWHIDGTCIVRTVGASGEMAWHMDMVIDGENSTVACDVSAIDTTGALDITVTAEWDTADADNIFTCTMGFMEYKN